MRGERLYGKRFTVVGKQPRGTDYRLPPTKNPPSTLTCLADSISLFHFQEEISWLGSTIVETLGEVAAQGEEEFSLLLILHTFSDDA